MNHHVPDDLLQAFVDGEVGEQVATHVASHLDACPSCATRAAGLEPLAAAFAAVEDPVPPEALRGAVMARLRRPERVPVIEVAVGALLLAAAALLSLGLQSPVSAIADLGTSLEMLDVFTRGVSSAVGSNPLGLVAAVVMLAAGAAVTWLGLSATGGAAPLGRLR